MFKLIASPQSPTFNLGQQHCRVAPAAADEDLIDAVVVEVRYGDASPKARHLVREQELLGKVIEARLSVLERQGRSDVERGRWIGSRGRLAAVCWGLRLARWLLRLDEPQQLPRLDLVCVLDGP